MSGERLAGSVNKKGERERERGMKVEGVGECGRHGKWVMGNDW